MRLTEQRMQCAGCGRYFSGLTNFDKHRASIPDTDRRICRNPEEVGLVDRGGYWAGPPMTDEQKAKMGWSKGEED